MAEMSPMLRQYVSVKEQNQDKILFFRVGDFYEMFFDDAVLASKELELTLTGKDFGLEDRAPMCGVPHHSAEAYVKRLIEKGHKVAICDQVEDAAPAKGLVAREVVRVVTPGTVIENSMLQDDRNNYIASIFIQADVAGLCFADISTGLAQTSNIRSDNIEAAIISELSRFQPREVLFNGELLEHKPVTDYIKMYLRCSVELLDNEVFSPQQSFELLHAHFGDALDAMVRLPRDSYAFFSLGALIGYLKETQKKGVERLKTVIQYEESQYMNLPLTTRANLELTETLRGREKIGTLLWVLEKTATAMGKRMLRNWLEQPLMHPDMINNRLDGIQELYDDNVQRLEIGESLTRVFDMERLMTRIVFGNASPREVYALASTCEELPVLKKKLEAFNSGELQSLNNGIDLLGDVLARIVETITDDPPALLKDGGVIRDGFNPEVDELRGIVHGGKDILAGIEAQLKEETGIRTLKIGFNKVYGYYIEVSKSFTALVPDHFIRKQTLTTGERYITEELKTLENKILGAGERLNVLERDLFNKLLEDISKELGRIQLTAGFVARLDVLVSLAQVAVANAYVRPVVDQSDVIEIRQGRHPVVEKMTKDTPFVPNDARLDCGDNRMQIITGPNMAGKSTYMRQTALILILAQIGSFVPAEYCHVGVCDAVFTRVGASDDLAQGKSTFMVEMTEVAEILEHATKNSLVILDEIGRGTSTFDGMSIAQSVVEYIADPGTGPGCKTMFATHYHELTDLENSADGVKNYNIAVKKRGDNITFLRRIVRGPADDSYGIQVAKLAGLPDGVVNRAKQVLHVLESTSKALNNVTQLDFDTLPDTQNQRTPEELVEKLMQVDPETFTPIEALNLLYELKGIVGNEK